MVPSAMTPLDRTTLTFPGRFGPVVPGSPGSPGPGGIPPGPGEPGEPGTTGPNRPGNVSVVRSSGVMALGTIASRGTGFRLTLVLAYSLAAAAVSVAYTYANALPN